MIEIHEGDGFLQDDGIPTMVILKANGRMFPYSADKKISDMFKDLGSAKNAQTETKKVEIKPLTNFVSKYPENIQKGDIVKLVSKIGEDREEDLVVGEEYSVLSVKNGLLDIVCSNADFPVRCNVLLKEVEFVRRPERAEKKIVYSEVVKCKCGEDVAIEKIDGEYVGLCDKCLSEVRK